MIDYTDGAILVTWTTWFDHLDSTLPCKETTNAPRTDSSLAIVHMSIYAAHPHANSDVPKKNIDNMTPTVSHTSDVNDRPLQRTDFEDLLSGPPGLLRLSFCVSASASLPLWSHILALPPWRESASSLYVVSSSRTAVDSDC
jgi:hypothetical protein